MKLSDIYREAAKMMEDGDGRYSCFAVSAVAGEETNGSAVKLYERWFRPEGSGEAWMVDYPGNRYDDNNMQTARDRRVLALCFMAAIAEDEERAATKRRK